MTCPTISPKRDLRNSRFKTRRRPKQDRIRNARQPDTFFSARNPAIYEAQPPKRDTFFPKTRYNGLGSVMSVNQSRMNRGSGRASFNLCSSIVLRLSFVLVLSNVMFGQTLGDTGYAWLNRRIESNQRQFYLFDTADSAFNKGFPSGRFPPTAFVATPPTSCPANHDADQLVVDPGCIPDLRSSDGCAGKDAFDPNGTVMRLRIGGLGSEDFVGMFFEEPESSDRIGTVGYNMSGSQRVVFEIAAPNGNRLQFNVGPPGEAGNTFPASGTWTQYSIALPNSCCANLQTLFAITAAGSFSSNGTALVRKIRFEPAPKSQMALPSLPLSFDTFGVTPLACQVLPGRVTVPIDQVLRNVATTSESALALIALARRGTVEDLGNVQALADAMVYAQIHDNHGLPIPAAPDGSRGLRNAYMGGDLALHNDQTQAQTGAPQVGLKDDVRLTGFSFEGPLCGVSQFCLVLNGASGGTNATAILALLTASVLLEQNLPIQQRKYLNAARELGNWIYGTLLDRAKLSFSGYLQGFPDNGIPPTALLRGKSTADNARIFAAFHALALATSGLPNTESAEWERRASLATAFVAAMFEPISGSFYAGTVNIGDAAAASGPGVILDGPRLGDDLVNIYDYLDAQTIPILVFAASGASGFAADAFRRAVDWFLPEQKALVAGGQMYTGFNLVQDPTDGPDGIGWEYTAQAALAMRLAGNVAGQQNVYAPMADALVGQLRAARQTAPFTDQQSVVAATMADQPTPVSPYEHCISIPFQCVPLRPGLGATLWAIFAETNFNPFDPRSLGLVR